MERDFCKRLAIGIADAHKTACIRCGEVCKVGLRDLVNDRQALFAFLDGVDIELVCKCGVLAVCRDGCLDIGHGAAHTARDERVVVCAGRDARVNNGVSAACIEREVRTCDIDADFGSLLDVGNVDRNGLDRCIALLEGEGDGRRAVRNGKDSGDDAVCKRSIAFGDLDCVEVCGKVAELEGNEVGCLGVERGLLVCREDGCLACADDIDAVACRVDCIVERSIGSVERVAVRNDCGARSGRELGGNDRDEVLTVDRVVAREEVGLACELEVEGVHLCRQRLARKVDSRLRRGAVLVGDIDVRIRIVGVEDGIARAHLCRSLDARRIEHLAFGLLGRRGKLCREVRDIAVLHALDRGDLIGDLLTVSDDLVRCVGDREGIGEGHRGVVGLGEGVTDGHDAVHAVVVEDDVGTADEIGSRPRRTARIDDPLAGFCRRRTDAGNCCVLRAAVGRREARDRTDDVVVLTGKDTDRTVADAHQRSVPGSARIDLEDLEGELHRLTCDEHAVADVVLACAGSRCGRVLRLLGQRGLIAPGNRRDGIGKSRKRRAGCAAVARERAVAVILPVVLDRDEVRHRNGLSAFRGFLLGRDDDAVFTRLIGIIGRRVDLVLVRLKDDGLVRPTVVHRNREIAGRERFAFDERRFLSFELDLGHFFPAAAGNEEEREGQRKEQTQSYFQLLHVVLVPL